MHRLAGWQGFFQVMLVPHRSPSAKGRAQIPAGVMAVGVLQKAPSSHGSGIAKLQSDPTGFVDTQEPEKARNASISQLRPGAHRAKLAGAQG